MNGGMSRTAVVAAFARGVGVSALQRDPLAAVFASESPWSPLEYLVGDGVFASGVRSALRAATAGLIDHNTVRMLVIDDLLRTQLSVCDEEKHTKQVVILGAGLDSRAWRLPHLRGHSVFEVDRDDGQRTKRRRVRGLQAFAERVVMVPVDMACEPLAPGLDAAGFERGRPAIWVCEGVSVYLTPEQLAELLRQVALLCAPGSTLILSYVTPPTVYGGGSRRLTMRVLAAMGERACGLLTPADATHLVQDAGFAIDSDWDWEQWATRVPHYSPRPNSFREHLIVARPAERGIQ